MPHAVVLQKILVVLVVMALGWAARRRGLLDTPGTAACSRVVVDVAFPALVLVQLPRTLDAGGFLEALPVALAGLLLVAGGTLVGRLLARGPTGAFLVGLPNWIFLPLLIAEALYGGEGVRAVLLVNAGAQLSLWTLGVGTLRGGSLTRGLRGLLNPGLVATGLGLGVALGWPGAAAILRGEAGEAWWSPGAGAVVEGLALVGALCVPLSLFTTGAQLAETTGRPALGELLRVLLGRLLLVPALFAAGIWLAGDLFDPTEQAVLLITGAMPVAISGSLFSQRYGGDAPLAARAVLVSTLLSLGTVPGLLWLALRFVAPP